MGADAARTMKRSKAIVNRMETQISEKEKLLKDIEYIDSLTMNSQASHHKRLLSVEDLQLGYENLLFEPIHFTIEPHQRVAISGPNGAGKSSIIHYLLGAFNGKVIGENPSQNILALVMYAKIMKTIEERWRNLQRKNQVDYQAFLNNLRKLGMERDVFHNKIEQMSMGQRKKWNWLNLYHSQLNYIYGMNH